MRGGDSAGQGRLRKLSIIFRNKQAIHEHTRKRKRGPNTKVHHKFYSKSMITLSNVTI